MKTTRVGGGHPNYTVLADPGPAGSQRSAYQQDLWHYTLARMVDACAAYGIKAFYGPFGDFSDPEACEAQFRNAFLHGCVELGLCTRARSISQNEYSASTRPR